MLFAILTCAFGSSLERLLDDFGPNSNYVLLAGDAAGIRVAVSGGSRGPGASMCEPYLIWSATKITTAAAIGAAVAEGYLGWDDRVHQHIDWWTSDEADGRSHVTLKHLLSLSSGFGARYNDNCGISNDRTYDTERCVKEIYNSTSAGFGCFSEAGRFITSTKCYSDYESGSRFAYAESPFPIAQLVAMKATNEPTWRDFFRRFFADPLNLTEASVVNIREEKQMRNEFVHATLLPSGPMVYGFWNPSHPDGGAHLIISPLAYARFLTEFSSGRFVCDKESILNGYIRGYPEKGREWGGIYDDSSYGLGNWVFPDSTGYESPGMQGVQPFIFGEANESLHESGGWIYLGQKAESIIPWYFHGFSGIFSLINGASDDVVTLTSDVQRAVGNLLQSTQEIVPMEQLCPSLPQRATPSPTGAAIPTSIPTSPSSILDAELDEPLMSASFLIAQVSVGVLACQS
jgi:CubicO group peptidase (beta-lactamase class C family)